MLKIESLSVYYGHIRAVEDVSFEVNEGEIVTLIGGNGAGKSTILKTISGMIAPKNGRIVYCGEEIQGLPADVIAKKRLLHCPEGRGIFPGLTVAENLEVGTYIWRKRSGEKNEEDLELVLRMFPRLKERYSQLGWSLSGGEQQMLAMARSIMGRPKLLMLDEPSLGLAPIIIQDMFETIKRISVETKLPILLVEQNAFMALNTADRGYVIENGLITAHSGCKELLDDPVVQKAYLGVS
ncbi:MAG: ABC transporter ATP-binding protein [Clostridiaceae bacterium]|nr:ABC transporter ATP-binding protein [Eubacteriales bacterium]